MSSIATTVSPLLTGDEILKPITQVKGTKEKKENLGAKFFKSMVFGYWNLLRLKEDSVITEDVYNQALGDYLKPFASVTDQTALYESFENDFKMLSKDLKKMIKDHHKPPKVKKEKKVKEVKEKKVKVNDDKDDLVSRIVEAALTSTEPSVPCKPKRKYTRKKSDNKTTDAAADSKTKTTDADAESKTTDAVTESKTKVTDAVAESKTKVIDADTVSEDQELVEEEIVDYCLGCETGLDNDDGHRDPKTNNYFPNCCCATNEDKLHEEEQEQELVEEEEEELDVEHFTFNDGFECLLNPNDLSLYDIVSHKPIFCHSLKRISLPNNQTMLLDNDNHAY